MAKAIWKDRVIAESDRFEEVEGNVYFPPDTVNTEYLHPSATRTTCGWKGEANYYNIVVDGQINADSAWYYPSPKAAASRIKNHVAFWRGFSVEG